MTFQKPRQAWALILLLLLPAGVCASQPVYRFDVLALLGTRAPGGGTLRGAFKPAAVGENGEVAFVAGVGSRGAEGLFFDTLGAILVVAQPGADAGEGWRFAEAPGPLAGVASPVAMNRAGDLAFAADIGRDDQTGAGVLRWEQATGTLEALALPGRPGPGGVTFGNALPRPSISDAGDVAFSVETGPPSESTAAPRGIFLSTGGEIRPVALPGDAAPEGGTLVRAGPPSLNNRRQIAFEAAIERDGRRSSALLVWEEGQLRTIASEGTELPGLGRLRQVREPRLNDAGQIAFFGDTGEWGIFLDDAGHFIQLAAPGKLLPFGHRVRSLVPGDGSLALNQDGAVAMLLPLEEPEANGLFVYQQGVLTAVALPGTFLAGVGPVDRLGEHVALGSQGHLAFQAELADGEVALVFATPVPPGG